MRQRPKHAAPKTADVPNELRSQDYGFPRVQLPADRAHPSALELHNALADDDTQPIDGKVVDGTPKPVRVEGLAPAAAPSIPVPSTPFLNAGMAQRPRVAAAGSALPAALTPLELDLLRRAVNEIPGDPDAPTQAMPAVPQRPRFGEQSAHRPRAEITDNGVLILRSFFEDPDFSGRLSHHIKQVSVRADELTRTNETQLTDLRFRLASLDKAHRAAVAAEAPGQYAQQLAAAASPLPRRVPGSALAIEAGSAGSR